MRALLLMALVSGQSPTVGEKMVTHARTFLGAPYVFGGRSGEGLDCMGTVFAAAEGVQRCGWKSFSVFPSTLRTDRSLGASVEGLSPVASDKLDVTWLAAGDVLMLVEKTENPREPAIGELDGHPVWVWHMGLYSGDGKWIVGDHFAGQVVETDLVAYLKEHADTYEGVWVLRPAKVAPTKCRRHAPIKR